MGSVKKPGLNGRIVEEVLCTFGDDPPTSLLFGAPAISLQQIERSLALEPHSLDPADLVTVLGPVAETSFPRRHHVEYRQLKRGKGFEDWLVFKPDMKAPVRAIKKKPVQPLVEAAAMPVLTGAPSLPSKDPANILAAQSRPPAAAPDKQQSPEPRTIALELLPEAETHPAPVKSSKAKAFLGASLFSRGKPRDEQETRPHRVPIDEGKTEQITLPAPHKMADQPWPDMLNVPVVAQGDTARASGAERPMVKDTQPRNVSQPVSAARSHEPRAANKPSSGRAEREGQHSKTPALAPSLPGPMEAKRALRSGQEAALAASKLEKEAALRRRPEGGETFISALRDTRPQATVVATPPQKLQVEVEEEQVIEAYFAEESLSPPRTEVPPPMPAISSTPDSAASFYSDASGPSALASAPPTPTTSSSSVFSADTESLPPTPWLEVAFHDLPFGPGAPAMQLQVNQWLQDRWQLLAAQFVAILACAYIVHASGL